MDRIIKALDEMERLKGIQILHACETGSRAWGFPSPDSDYDIRFLYKHEKNWYLQLGLRKDSIESMIGDLDITGWDLRKSLLLLKKSNTSLIERFQSPKQYRTMRRFSDEFSTLIKHYYSPGAVYFHHYSLVMKFREKMGDRSAFRLKSFFYLLRSLLSCNWIVNDVSVPPMHIEGLMKYINDESREIIREMIVVKANREEAYIHEATRDQLRLISHLFKSVEEKGVRLPVNVNGFDNLNTFFIKQLDAIKHK